MYDLLMTVSKKLWNTIYKILLVKSVERYTVIIRIVQFKISYSTKNKLKLKSFDMILAFYSYLLKIICSLVIVRLKGFIFITWRIADETAKLLPLLRARFQTTANIDVINGKKGQCRYLVRRYLVLSSL